MMVPASLVATASRPALAGLGLALEQIDVADELRDPARIRRLIQLARGCDLLETAVVHHADPVGHRHRLLLVVGDDDEGHAEPPLQLHQFELGAFAQLLVERGQGLVEQQHPRTARQRARQRHALPLAAGKLVRLALLQALEFYQRDHLGDADVDLGTRHLRALQPERDIVPHRKMRKQRVVLEHHVDRALVRQHLRDIGAVQQDAAFVRRLEAGQHPQQRGLAAAARTEQREKFAAPDIERQAVHRPQRAELLHHRIDAQQRHVGRDRRRLGLWPDTSIGRRFGFRRIRIVCAFSCVFRHDSSLPRRRQASGGTARTQPRARRAAPNCLS